MKKKWTTRAFIDVVPIEEYSRQEINDFFREAWDRAFRAIGYEPFIDKEEFNKYVNEAKEHGVIIDR